ncbi:MAG: amidohydrolase family protein [Burkholderiales bacterium]
MRWLRALALSLVVLLASLLAVLAIGLLWPTTEAPVQRTTTAIAITGARVVDVASGSAKDGLTVVVAGGRVITVGAAAEVAPPAGSQVVDGAGRYLVPGFWDMHAHLHADNPAYRANPRLEFVPWMQRQVWMQDADRMAAGDPSPEGRRAHLDFYHAGLALTANAHARGVRILAGTDANDTYSFPGSGLHDELEELVQAGLSPADALRASITRGPEYFGLSKDYGAVEVGKLADLVLLDGNPLEDIRNTRRISVVIFNGNAYRRGDLDRLLDYVKSQARSLPLSIKIIWAFVRSQF